MEKFKVNSDIFNDSELEKATRELYNAFVNDVELYKEVKSQGFTDQDIFDNIGHFSDLKADREKEKLVKTFDDCKKYDCFYHTNLVRKPYGIEKVYDATAPYKEHLKYIGHFIIKDFNDDYNNIEWKKLLNKSAKKAVSEEIKANNWVYLTGTLRTGRTYLAIAILNNFVSKNDERVAFIDAPKTFGMLARLYFIDRNDFEDLMNQLKECSLLVIDNFGTEVKNSIVRDAIVIPLLEYRATTNKLTVFTSNHDIKRIATMYQIKKDAGGEVAAQFLESILRGKISSEINMGNEPLF